VWAASVVGLACSLALVVVAVAFGGRLGGEARR
jgi:hypothetical protein